MLGWPIRSLLPCTRLTQTNTPQASVWGRLNASHSTCLLANSRTGPLMPPCPIPATNVSLLGLGLGYGVTNV